MDQLALQIGWSLLKACDNGCDRITSEAVAGIDNYVVLFAQGLIFSKSPNSPVTTSFTPSSDLTVSADLVGRTYAVMGHSGWVFFSSLMRGAGSVS